MFKFRLGSFGAFLIFNDLLSTFDLNFQGYWYRYYGGKFIPYRYSFIDQMTKQIIKAPGPLVFLWCAVTVIFFWCLAVNGTQISNQGFGQFLVKIHLITETSWNMVKAGVKCFAHAHREFQSSIPKLLPPSVNRVINTRFMTGFSEYHLYPFANACLFTSFLGRFFCFLQLYPFAQTLAYSCLTKFFSTNGL